jgi:hypothetical protein
MSAMSANSFLLATSRDPFVIARGQTVGIEPWCSACAVGRRATWLKVEMSKNVGGVKGQQLMVSVATGLSVACRILSPKRFLATRVVIRCAVAIYMNWARRQIGVVVRRLCNCVPFLVSRPQLQAACQPNGRRAHSALLTGKMPVAPLRGNLSAVELRRVLSPHAFLATEFLS